MLVGGIDILGMYCVDLTPAIGKQVIINFFLGFKNIKIKNLFDFKVAA